MDASYFDRDAGVMKEARDFFPITTFGKQAQNDAKYLKKGAQEGVKGRIKSWYTPEDQKGGFNFSPSHSAHSDWLNDDASAMTAETLGQPVVQTRNARS